jgi:mannose-6-phosphate isomerase-like protein (cupin superfamily)
MSDRDTAIRFVYTPGDIVWHKTSLGREFWLSDLVVDSSYSSLYNAQLSRFGPGGGSPLHEHTYNHAFYFLTGIGTVQIGDQTWTVEPGTFVKVPAFERHSVTNTGVENLDFLVIYDPPNRDGIPPSE